MHPLLMAHLAAPGFLKDLLAELKFKGVDVQEVIGELVVCSSHSYKIWWSQQTWQNLKKHRFASISEATKFLKSQGHLWLNHSSKLHRRGQLIHQNLRTPKDKKFEFLKIPQLPSVGAWTLLSETELLYSPQVTPPVARGQWNFIENKDLPSRAYLKLWELFSVTGVKPQKKSRILELGASPGGWTQVLEELDCDILAIDRSPLAPHLMKSKRIMFKTGDAFRFSPEKVQECFGSIDWLFSDLICAPEKLHDYLQAWLHLRQRPSFVCTLKFKGEVDLKVVQKFADIEGSEVRHLSQNKHELTWTNLVS